MKTSSPPKRIYEYRIRRLACSAKEKAVPYGDIKLPERAAAFLRTCLVHQDREHFIVLHLNIRTDLVGYEITAIGGTHGVGVHPSEVFRGAIIAGSSGIIVAHNHPSGDPSPSPDDDRLTERIIAAGRMLGIPMVDHIVFTTDRHVSYLDYRKDLFNME